MTVPTPPRPSRLSPSFPTVAALLASALVLASVAASAAIGPDPSPDAVLDPRIGPGTVLAISKSGAGRSPLGASSSASSLSFGPSVPKVHADLNGCTANWLWKDQDANLYLGTAGHCLMPEGKTSTHGSGADFDASDVRVYACATACPVGGATALGAAYVAPQWVELGPVAYAAQMADPHAFGPDFGLVKIPAGLEGQLDPALKGWGGPTGVAPVTRGDLLLLHGNGIGFGETAAGKGRAGVFLHARTDGLWEGNVPISGGDSGSAVGSAASVSGPVLAAGIATHSLCSVEVYGNPVSSQNSLVCTEAGIVAGGPTVAKAAAMARDAGLCIEVVLAGEDLSALTPAAAC